ncbi:hypothetical protein A2572_01005 [Candidatus Collierbacteria bacterium RIFOXYD1_FULL_40_9]|uniref:Probable inosine/xanthosine triphosphatase n=1 Tax=Candidatus Collierbacteria bacterium RIFOXYD1_FULL_40_9 TaxID=1817731 RepID=A0A1F5FTT4_9BACT|nr:MAG: hypothetical protein A2572_01005 [Candidatus Collierbacteria bacterium RIFOXYD1_FULL_40_9]
MNKIRVFVGSINPVKELAVKSAFQKTLPQYEAMVHGLAVPSGVRAQPMTDAETLLGAKNRLANLTQFATSADFWVGIEGGVEVVGRQIESFAWVVVKSKEGVYGKSRTATFTLPSQVSELVLKGMELGDADDLVFGQSNSKRTNGSVGIMTGDIITRTTYYEHALILALIPFKSPDLY